VRPSRAPVPNPALLTLDWAHPRVVLPTITVMAAFLGYVLVNQGPVIAVAPFVLAGATGTGLLLLRNPVAAVGVLIVLLTACPVARASVGPVPVYGVDVLIVLTLLAIGRRKLVVPRVSLLVVLYVLSSVPALVYQSFTTGYIAESTYGFLRHVVAVSAVAIGWWLGARVPASRVASRAFVGGTIFTSLLAVGQAVPATATMTKTLITQISPELATQSYLRYPERSFALFQAPTALSGFLVIMFVMLGGLALSTSGRLRRWTLATMALAALGIVATYSRQWVPALAAALFVIGALRPRALVSGGALLLVLATIVWLTLGAGILSGDYLGERFRGQGGTAANIADRLAQPGEFLEVQSTAGPLLVLGRGFAGSDLVYRGLVDSSTARLFSEGLPTENSILLEFFNHGLVAGVLLMLILAVALARGLRVAKHPGPHQTVALTLSAALTAAIVLALSDQYFSEAIFMKALLWLLIGAITGLKLPASSVPRRRRRAPQPGGVAVGDTSTPDRVRPAP
jgi:hypothetical protein